MRMNTIKKKIITPVMINNESKKELEEKLSKRKVVPSKVADAMVKRILELGWTSKYAKEDFKDIDRSSSVKSSINCSNKHMLDELELLGLPYDISKNDLIRRELYGIICTKNNKLIDANINDLKKYACTDEENMPKKLYVDSDFTDLLRGSEINGVIELVIKRAMAGDIDLLKYVHNDEKMREKASNLKKAGRVQIDIADSVNAIKTISMSELINSRDMLFAILEYIRINPIVIGEYKTYLRSLMKTQRMGLGKDVVTLLDTMIEKGKIKDYDEYLIECFNSVTISELEREIKAKIENKDHRKQMHKSITFDHKGEVSLKHIDKITTIKEVNRLNWTSVIDSMVKIKYLKDLRRNKKK